MAQMGRFCARRGWWVLGAWVVFLAAATLGHRLAGGHYSDDLQLPGSSAQQGADLLQAHEPGAGGYAGQIVFTVGSASLRAYSSELSAAAAAVGRLPHVLAISDPLAAGRTSQDGRTAYAAVRFDVDPKALGPSSVAAVDRAVAGVRAAGVRVDYGGVLGQAARPKPGEARSEVIGVVVAIVVLLVGFGSVYAAGLPILTALVGVGTGVGILGVAAAASPFASVAPTLGIMIGLGVGIDYALFLCARHRQLLMTGVRPAEAAAGALATSGRSVLVAAATVVIAMLGLFASGIGFVGKLGLAASITVAVSALAAITLIPALLGLAGHRIDRWWVRRPVAEGAASGHDGATGWHRHAARVGRHPWRYLGAGIAALAVLAVPALSMTLGHIDAGANPTSFTDRRAYDAISRAFGPGANRPFVVVVRLADGVSDPALAPRLTRTLASTPGIASVSPARTTADGALLVATVVPATSPRDAATDRLLTRLDDETLPRALAGTGSRGYVTGFLAASLEFDDQVAARLPVIIAVVLAAAFLLLVVSFRAPVLALKAAVLNLLSIGAAYGVIVAVFQWGWGNSLLGVDKLVPVEAYVPMMMFAIVFGLSMDYEVFLLSRVRERWIVTGDNARAVADGLAATARVITCAALIMASVFLAFLLSGNIIIKMLALGLGISVLIDASLIRLIVVPATMFLLSQANWWLPRWLDRLLPRPEPAPAPGSGSGSGLDTERKAHPEPATT
ncbi:putative integral membrane export protein [Frankia canadensis]|uniref:Putative integral membrane export protein n=1 Tax=Frankia canadensis TaxID=1836972 RepID=A0A2I2KS97_9ACTN|nr:putative integral membrane export protein [Frankia canadensis]SOU55820.1 putative integral membrane export protein [Frankia canadensis]